MKNKVIWIVLGLTLIVGLSAVAMAVVGTSSASRGEFGDDGYVLGVGGEYASSGELSSASISTTYFSDGESYRKGYLDSVRFPTPRANRYPCRARASYTMRINRSLRSPTAL